jgi:hypothetical protein
MKESLQAMAAIVLIAAAAFGIFKFLLHNRSATVQNIPVTQSRSVQTHATDVGSRIPLGRETPSPASVSGNKNEVIPQGALTFIGHHYSTSFPRTENPISEGGVWIGGEVAGNGCGGKPCWGNMQTTPGRAYGVSEPTQYGDPTAILTGTWGPNQTVQGTVVAADQPLRRCCHELELRLRSTISPNMITGYEVYCSMVLGDQYCHVASWGGPNGSYVNLDDCLGLGRLPSIKNGDVLKATIVGTNPVLITAYVNGDEIMALQDEGTCTFSDGHQYGPWIRGNPGIGQYDSEDSNFSSFGWSNFSATDGLNVPR